MSCMAFHRFYNVLCFFFFKTLYHVWGWTWGCVWQTQTHDAVLHSLFPGFPSRWPIFQLVLSQVHWIRVPPVLLWFPQAHGLLDFSTDRYLVDQSQRKEREKKRERAVSLGLHGKPIKPMHRTCTTHEGTGHSLNEALKARTRVWAWLVSMNEDRRKDSGDPGL